jgi:type IV fimbrial biogenesis protein FimT
MVLRRLRRLDARGFGLTELLVTVAVIGIVAVVGYPYFSSFVQASRVKAAARELSAIINGARSLAIARNTRVCVTLTGNQATYRRDVTAACGGGVLFTGPMTRADGTIPLANDMQISATTNNVVFTNLGGVTAGGTYTVRDPQTNQTMNVVVATSGRVTLQ